MQGIPGPQTTARATGVTADDEEDTTRRARLLRRLTAVMICVGLFGAVTSLLQSRNATGTTVVFYVLVIAPVVGVGWLARRGRLVLAAWLLTSLFWAIIAAVTLLFGGLQGQNAASFTVCVLLIGSLVGSRPALAVAVVSTAWCAGVAYLETQGRLPHQLGDYTPFNGWIAVTTTLILTAFLLASALEWLRALNARVERSARERDEVLRRSIEGQKMELVGKITAGIAHDFNNLLTVMVTVGEALRYEHGAAPDTSLLDALDEAVSRATLLTRQLVSIGHGPRPGPAAVDVGDTVAGLARMLPHLLGPRVIIAADVVTGAVAAAPRAAIEQIVLNLAVNAKEAMPTGGQLRLTVTADPSTVTLVAADEGAGMDAATRARIFEPFFSTKATGTGLGLATVHRLVVELGGAITVDSEPGRGARFTITLPRITDALTPAASPTTIRAALPTMARRILVVEDDALVRRALIRMLIEQGFEPVAVGGGREALALLDVGADLACVVTDLAMPEMDGEQLAARVTALRPTLPIVMISGDRQPVRISNLGARRAFVAKPIDAAALRGALDSVMPPASPPA